MNIQRGCILVWSFLIALVAGPLLAAPPTTKPSPGRIRLTISKKTTHILGPVNKDGTVNYMAYLNAKYSKGVTKANNAAIPLIEIFGPDILPKDALGKICEILKIKPPVEGKTYFIPLYDYLDKTLSNEEANAWKDRDHGPTMTMPKPWNAKRYPVAAKWLKANNGALNATLVAMRRTRYYMPAVSPGPDESVMNMLVPGVKLYVDLGYALVERAMLKLDSGDMRGAWADLTATRHLARRIGSGPTLLEGLVAIGVEGRACFACYEVAGNGKLTGAQARAFLADMRRLKPLPNIANTLAESDRFMALDSVMVLARKLKRKGRVKTLDWPTQSREPEFPMNMMPSITLHDKSMDWDEVLKVINPWYDRYAASVSLKGQATVEQDPHISAISFDEHTAKVFAFRPLLPFFAIPFDDPSAKGKVNPVTRRLLSQMIGHVMVSDLVPQVGRAFVLRDRAVAEGDLSLVAMALAAYRAEKKAYPDKLSQLAPGYLKKVPDDLFVDKPFAYKRTDKGYLLYSVGENMKYDGPKKEDDDDDKNDDIVVRVE